MSADSPNDTFLRPGDGGDWANGQEVSLIFEQTRQFCQLWSLEIDLVWATKWISLYHWERIKKATACRSIVMPWLLSWCGTVRVPPSRRWIYLHYRLVKWIVLIFWKQSIGQLAKAIQINNASTVVRIGRSVAHNHWTASQLKSPWFS